MGDHRQKKDKHRSAGKKVELMKMISFEPLYELGSYVDIQLPGDEVRRHQLQEYIVKEDSVWYGFDGLKLREGDVRKYAVDEQE